ncbi:MAG: hypothetical protein Tsb0015_05880 [Simkaniaceae bacterium]
MSRIFRLSLVFFFILGLDIATKVFIHTFFPQPLYEEVYPYGGLGVFQGLFGGIDFDITHVINRGGAWGMFAAIPKTLLTVRVVVVAFLAVYLLFLQKSGHRQLPLAFILAGASGNILDSFLYGHVIDMFHFTFWGYSFPVFNVADFAICIGFFLLVCSSLFSKKKAAVL